MNVHVSYKASKKPDVESQFNLHVEKLRKRLQVFRPDLVHLHATVESSPGREGVAVSLNLRLPSGQMAASGAGPTPMVALKKSFDDLQEQLAKHKARLREKYRWPHLRGGSRGAPRVEPQVPFEQTVAAVKLPCISSTDISSWVDANLNRLVRFVERELHYREVNNQLRPGLLSAVEVIDETIAAALGDDLDKPERLALEPWLYRLAMRSLDQLLARSVEEEADTVSLYQGVRRPNVEASDEAQLQFYQPDEAMVAQDNIPDRGMANPEEIAYSDEMIALVETALHGARGADREAFLLFAIEGFSPEEIAVIGDHSVEEVHSSILAAREHLRKNLPVSNELKEKLLHQTRIA